MKLYDSPDKCLAVEPRLNLDPCNQQQCCCHSTCTSKDQYSCSLRLQRSMTPLPRLSAVQKIIWNRAKQAQESQRVKPLTKSIVGPQLYGE